MTEKQGRQLVLFEGRPQSDTSFEGLWMDARHGIAPSRERMYRLLTALRQVFDFFDGASQLDRELCSALWTLGNYVPQMYRADASRGGSYRREFFDELFELEGRVANIFEGVWQDWVRLPGFEEELHPG